FLGLSREILKFDTIYNFCFTISPPLSRYGMNRVSDRRRVWLCFSICCQCQCRMAQQVILQITYRTLTANKYQCKFVVQCPYFVRRQQFPTCLLKISCVRTMAALGLSACPCVDGGLTQQFRY